MVAKKDIKAFPSRFFASFADKSHSILHLNQ